MTNVALKITNHNKHIAQTPDIKSRYSVEDKKKIADAARDFESLLTSMMLKSMTQTTGGLFGKEGFGGDYFDSMFETQIASYMSKSKSFGVSDQIFRKLTGEELSKFRMEIAQKPALKQPVKVEKITDNAKSISPSIGSLNRLDKYKDLISGASKKYGIDEKIIKSVILTESAANPRAVSKANAKGLMQLMDGTAKEMGVKNSFDPRQNIEGGVKYLAKMFDSYKGDIQLALAAYNAGPGNVNKYNGIPPFKETKNYITRVLGYMNYLDG